MNVVCDAATTRCHITETNKKSETNASQCDDAIEPNVPLEKMPIKINNKVYIQLNRQTFTLVYM